MAHITLRSGRDYIYGDKTQNIAFDDILAGIRQPRYTAQTRDLYSIAQHAVFVSEILQDWGCDEYTQYLGLHHDDHEALIGDFPSPFQWWLREAIQPYIKDEFKGFDPLGWAKNKLDEHIMPQLGIRWPAHDGIWKLVKEADYAALICESRQLFDFEPNWLNDFNVRHVDKLVTVVPASDAVELFINRHNELTKACGINLDAKTA